MHAHRWHLSAEPEGGGLGRFSHPRPGSSRPAATPSPRSVCSVRSVRALPAHRSPSTSCRRAIAQSLRLLPHFLSLERLAPLSQLLPESDVPDALHRKSALVTPSLCRSSGRLHLQTGWALQRNPVPSHAGRQRGEPRGLSLPSRTRRRRLGGATGLSARSGGGEAGQGVWGARLSHGPRKAVGSESGRRWPAPRGR